MPDQPLASRTAELGHQVVQASQSTGYLLGIVLVFGAGPLSWTMGHPVDPQLWFVTLGGLVVGRWGAPLGATLVQGARHFGAAEPSARQPITSTRSPS